MALRIIPIFYVRDYAATGSRQYGNSTSYVSIHPIPDMGPHTAEIVEVQGSDPLAVTRVMSQIPGNRSGRMNNAIPYIQAKLNTTLLLLHRFLHRWLGGRHVFLTLNRVPVNYGISPKRLHTDTEVVIKIQVRRERISSFGRSSYNTNVAHLAELRRLIGFTTQIQQRTVAMQSDLIELLDPGLLDAMHSTPMLLPHSIHQHHRPFWVISNLAAETSTAQLIELLHRYDTEVRAAATAQGNAPPPQLLLMVNIIVNIPACLMPPPPSTTTETSRRTQARTTAFLLLPRAGAIMLSPVPTSACIEQAGPWRTAAVMEVKEDGYLMEDIRTLARSGRGAAAATAILHPCTVSPVDYTEDNAIASIHGDLATALYEEPVSLAQPMPRPGAPPPPPNNAWSSNRANNASHGRPQGTHEPLASPMSSQSSSASPQHSVDSQPQHQSHGNMDSHSPQNPPGSTPIPLGTRATASPEGAHDTEPPPPSWFSHLAYQSDSSSDAKEDDEEEEMDTTQPLPTNLSSTPLPQEPNPPAPTQSVQELIAAAIQEAQRKAKEEFQKELANITLQHQQETQAIRAELLHGTQSLREDILTHSQQTIQIQQQQAVELQRIWDQRDRERAQAEAQRQEELLQKQETARMAAETEARAAQAKVADQQAKTEALLQAVLLHLQESKLETTRTPRLEAPSTTAAQTTNTASSSTQAPPPTQDLQWNTPPSLLPAQWIQHQMDSRSRALDQILDGSRLDSAHFMEAFHKIRHRPPRLDDMPHWQQLDLAPNPAHVDFQTVYLPVLLSVMLRMAELNHPPVIANPLWSAQLAQLETHIGHWNTLRSQIQHPATDQEDQAFRSQFQTTHSRLPLQDDVPTWHHIILTENIITHRPLTWAEYQAAARQHMLRPVAPTPQATRLTTADLPDSASSTPPAYTPLSSPPRQAPVPTPVDNVTDPTHRTSVTTSPCLTDKRRSRTSDDRSIAQQQLKEQQIASKRQTRRSAQAPPGLHQCCNRACTIPTPPTVGDGGICTVTRRIMHIACSAPGQTNECLSCSFTTGTSAT